jgi:methylglyoxal synthase
MGGDKQFMEMISRNGMDMVIFFYNPTGERHSGPNIDEISECCDRYNIPIATNIATAESLILGLAHGDLEWREQI